jgi:hypothetical protein
MTDRMRCMAQALLPDGQWKTCIRELGHPEERHVWLESFARADGRPMVMVWTGVRSTAPFVARVLLPNGPIPEKLRRGAP